METTTMNHRDAVAALDAVQEFLRSEAARLGRGPAALVANAIASQLAVAGCAIVGMEAGAKAAGVTDAPTDLAR